MVRREWLKDGLVVLAVLVVAWVFWRHIPTLEIIGEGAFNFVELHRESFDTKVLWRWSNYYPFVVDRLAQIMAPYLWGWFGDRVSFYMWFLLGWMLATDVLMYVFVKVVTKSRLVAFLAMTFFSLSFVGNFNMWSSGGYQYFLQRGVLMLPLLISLTLLVVYLSGGGLGYYLSSLALYLLTVFLGFFATWFLPVFVFYPWSCLILAIRKGWRGLVQWVWIPLPFVVGNWLMIRRDPTVCLNGGSCAGGPLVAVFDFLFKDPGIEGVVSGVAQQLTVMTLPFWWDSELLKFLRLSLGFTVAKGKYEGGVLWLWLGEAVMVLLYLLAGAVVWRRKPKWRSILLTAVFSMVGVAMINMKMNESALLVFTTWRYFYYPFVLVALFWAMVFASLVELRRRWLTVLSVVMVVLALGYNFLAIQRQMAVDRWEHQANREALNKLHGLSPVLKQKPYRVYMKAPLGGYGLEFARGFYSHPEAVFDPHLPDLSKLVESRVNPDEVFVFRYDYDERRIVDETDKYRGELRRLEQLKFR